MTEAEREAFLARFSASNQETLVGLAVMGGIFGEGIDLVGERLIGVVVVGVVCVVSSVPAQEVINRTAAIRKPEIHHNILLVICVIPP